MDEDRSQNSGRKSEISQLITDYIIIQGGQSVLRVYEQVYVVCR